MAEPAVREQLGDDAEAVNVYRSVPPRRCSVLVPPDVGLAAELDPDA